jgi:hypothetical protein
MKIKFQKTNKILSSPLSVEQHATASYLHHARQRRGRP